MPLALLCHAYGTTVPILWHCCANTMVKPGKQIKDHPNVQSPYTRVETYNSIYEIENKDLLFHFFQ